jgi:hypothetical protein
MQCQLQEILPNIISASEMAPLWKKLRAMICIIEITIIDERQNTAMTISICFNKRINFESFWRFLVDPFLYSSLQIPISA